MPRLLTLCAGILCLSLTAAAQDFTAALDATSPTAEAAAPAPASLYPSERYPWQLGMGFQYQHYNALGFTFHDEGFNTDLTRYLNNWFATNRSSWAADLTWPCIMVQNWSRGDTY